MTIFEDRNSTGSGGRSCPSDLSGSVGIGIGEVFELEAESLVLRARCAGRSHPVTRGPCLGSWRTCTSTHGSRPLWLLRPATDIGIDRTGRPCSRDKHAMTRRPVGCHPVGCHLPMGGARIALGRGGAWRSVRSLRRIGDRGRGGGSGSRTRVRSLGSWRTRTRTNGRRPLGQVARLRISIQAATDGGDARCATTRTHVVSGYFETRTDGDLAQPEPCRQKSRTLRVKQRKNE
jgi:hypothetical protein